jgi:hypothetical protein
MVAGEMEVGWVVGGGQMMDQDWDYWVVVMAGLKDWG